MSYLRVIPRDLFNEANLLKCYGQVYLNLELLNLPYAVLEHENDDEAFSVAQNPDDGSLSLWNVTLSVHGRDVHFWRPLNSREPWPLMASLGDGDEFQVFNDDGAFSTEMLSMLSKSETEIWED